MEEVKEKAPDKVLRGNQMEGREGNLSNKVVNVVLTAAIVMLLALWFDKAMLLAVSFPFVVIGWVTMGAIRKDRLGKGYALAMGSTLVIWLVSFIALNLINTKVAPTTYILGLPPGSFIMVFLVWVLPLFTFTYLYGHYFETDCLGIEEKQGAQTKAGTDVKGGA